MSGEGGGLLTALSVSLVQAVDSPEGGACGAPVLVRDQPALRASLTVLVEAARKFR